MPIPSAMVIEEALDMVRAVPNDYAELVSELEAAVDNPSPDLRRGYLLGICTARAILAQMPAAVKAGIML